MLTKNERQKAIQFSDSCLGDAQTTTRPKLQVF